LSSFHLNPEGFQTAQIIGCLHAKIRESARSSGFDRRAHVNDKCRPLYASVIEIQLRFVIAVCAIRSPADFCSDITFGRRFNGTSIGGQVRTTILLASVDKAKPTCDVLDVEQWKDLR
jgi:hypothetical protein